MGTTAVPAGSLAGKAVSGVLWTTGLSVFRDFLQFGVMLVLVRLLAPEAYGQFGLVTAIMGFLTVFSFHSFLEYTLQVRPGIEVDYQLHFTTGVFLQGSVFLLANLVAEVLKHWEKYAQVASLLHVMSILFLLELGHDFRGKMLEREMDWKRLRILEGIGVLANAGLSLLMAAAGAGVYALLVPSLLITIPAFVDLFVVQGWRPNWKWDAAGFAPVWRYGITRVMSGLLIWTRQLMESTILVQLVGFGVYGIYGRALGLATICCLKVPGLFTQALFPVLTKLDPGSDSSSRANTLVFCSVAWPTFPAALIFSALASPVILTLYGARWAGAIPFLPWAMAAGAATALSQTGTVLLIASLQQKCSLYIDAVTLAGAGLCLLVLAPRSLKLYLAGIAAVQTFSFFLILLRLYRKRAIDLRGIGSSLALPAFSASVSFLAVEFARAYLAIPRQTVGGALVCGILFCLIYVLLLRLTSGRQCREVVRFLPGRAYLERWLVLGT